MKKRNLPLGVSDFKKVRELDYFFVDKSLFIQEIIDSPAEVMLFPRPRRFGKTLGLSMLKTFLEKTGEDPAYYFKEFAIWERKEYHDYMARFPVISLTFKDIKEKTWSGCFSGIKERIQREYAKHLYLLESNSINEWDKKWFSKILDGNGDERAFESSLDRLSELLAKYWSEKTVILIDEYDTPIHAGFQNGYYDDVVGFLRNFFSGGLKDNPNLFKGVLTGILRIAKESIFSGLNNLTVYSILSKKFSDKFGFTSDEVQNLLDIFSLRQHREAITDWYDGYRFGDTLIYNPWSIVNCIVNEGELAPYWVNTADSSIIANLVMGEKREITNDLEELIKGNSIEKPIKENIVMRQLETQYDLAWSVLFFSGYLRTLGKVQSSKGYSQVHHLKVPNREVQLLFNDFIRDWFGLRIKGNTLDRMLKALVSGDIKLFEAALREVVTSIMSYHDFTGETEKVYQALIIGILVYLQDQYEIKSNRESGYGRYDVMMIPADKRKTGIILEFKILKDNGKKAVEKALDKALDQIKKKDYGRELKQRGIANILMIAIVFQGKKLWVKSSNNCDLETF